MPKIIAVAIPKGGVGKTTTAVNLATSLAVLDKKSLLIDLDPAGSCSVSFNLTKEQTTGGLIDLIRFNKTLNSVIHKTLVENLDLIPSGIFSYDEEEKSNRFTTNVLLLRNILEQNTLSYDYIIIDCPPYLHGMTNLGLAACHSILLPVKSANFSIQALQKMIVHLEWIKKNFNHNLRIEGILHTMFEQRTKVSWLTEEHLYRIAGKYVLNTKIPKSASVAESTYYGKPVVLFNAQSTGAIAYLKLAQEIIIRNKICPFISRENEISIRKISTVIPDQNLLIQNYPNPFSAKTNIMFMIKNENRYKLQVFTLQNEKVHLLFDTRLSPGKYEYTWTSNGLPSGVYIYRLESSDYNESKKMIFSKPG